MVKNEHRNRMIQKTLNFDGVEINKKKFLISKQPIDLNLVDVHKIVIASTIKYGDKNFKYFISYADDDSIRPPCIKLNQMFGFIKYFGNGGKNMSFMVKVNSELARYSEIWNKIKNLTSKKHLMARFIQTFMTKRFEKKIRITFVWRY